jgi:hypothetical protein
MSNELLELPQEILLVVLSRGKDVFDLGDGWQAPARQLHLVETL